MLNSLKHAALKSAVAGLESVTKSLQAKLPTTTMSPQNQAMRQEVGTYTPKRLGGLKGMYVRRFERKATAKANAAMANAGLNPTASAAPQTNLLALGTPEGQQKFQDQIHQSIMASVEQSLGSWGGMNRLHELANARFGISAPATGHPGTGEIANPQGNVMQQLHAHLLDDTAKGLEERTQKLAAIDELANAQAKKFGTFNPQKPSDLVHASQEEQDEALAAHDSMTEAGVNNAMHLLGGSAAGKPVAGPSLHNHHDHPNDPALDLLEAQNNVFGDNNLDDESDDGHSSTHSSSHTRPPPAANGKDGIPK